MKFNFLVITLLISSVIIAGCSAASSESGEHEAMDHSNMTNMEGMDHSNMTDEEMEEMNMENGHASHTNLVALNNSTGENELAIPQLIEPKDGVVTINAQQGTTEFLREFNLKHLDTMGHF